MRQHSMHMLVYKSVCEKLQAWGEEVQKKTSITGMGWGFYHDEKPYYIQGTARTDSNAA